MKAVSEWVDSLTSTQALKSIDEMETDENNKVWYRLAVKHFPNSNFVRYKKFYFPYPEWLKKQQSKLGFFGPSGFAKWVKFDKYLSSWYDDQPITDYNWYYLSPDIGEYKHVTREGVPLLFLAYAYKQMESVLCMPAGDGTDQKIYNLNYEDITAIDYQKETAKIDPKVTNSVFESYGHLFSQIASYYYKGGYLLDSGAYYM